MNLEPLAALPSSADHAAIAAALRLAADGLNGADALERETVRREAVAILEAKNIEAPARFVDAAFTLRSSKTDTLAGQSLDLVAPEPAPNPINGRGLLTWLADMISQYVSLPPGAADAVALLVVNAHAHEATDISPIGVISSPTPRCGKTRLISIIGGLTPKAIVAGAPTAASIFRAIEKWSPTLLVDEGDAVFGPKGSEDLRGVLDAGHTRSTAWVIRTVGDDHEPRRFSTWCPKFVALIGKLPPTLQDRGVIIPMRRLAKADRKRIKRLRLDRVRMIFGPLCEAACRWALDHLAELQVADPAMPDELDDRAQDNWRPLIAIADAAGGDWPERARKAALLLSGAGARAEEDGQGVLLLTDLRDLFTKLNADQLPTATILEGLLKLEDRPWTECNHGRPLTARGIADILRPFGVRPCGIRIGGDTPKGYRLKDLTDAFSSYVTDTDPQHPQQSNDIQGLDSKNDPQQTLAVADVKRGLTIEDSSLVAAVADSKGKSGEKTVTSDDDPLTEVPLL